MIIRAVSGRPQRCNPVAHAPSFAVVCHPYCCLCCPCLSRRCCCAAGQLVSGRLRVSRHTTRAAGDAITTPLVAPAAGVGAGRGSQHTLPGFVAHIERDGRIRFSDRRASGGLLVDPIYGPIGHAEFDITDWLLDQLGAGDDPYLAQRLAIMDQTRGSRIRRRINHDHRTMERALGDLPAYLRAVWEYQGWSHAERRHILFELWDEAAEDGNDFIREGGTRARIIIARFISSRLPAASSDAYTREELERINRQRSATVEFSPYQREAADKRRIAESESGFASIGLPLMRAF